MTRSISDDVLHRGDFVRLAYRLGRSGATGVLTIRGDGIGSSVLVLRRGFLMSGDAKAIDAGSRNNATAQRLARLAAVEMARYRFDGGTSAYPPGAVERQFRLATWARQHLERQVDSSLAQRLVRELAGVRLTIRDGLCPERSTCDDTDLRILDAMSEPRRLDQIWPLARTPRFRLLTFLHFLRSVGALRLTGVAAPPPHLRPRENDAHRLLGVTACADRATLKRAYRRLARALHPDLHPHADANRRRGLERKLAEVTQAYAELTRSAQP